MVLRPWFMTKRTWTPSRTSSAFLTELRSCHTALVEKYVIEGHVPAADIRRLLAEKAEDAGLAVPGMPRGTPGMAPPGTTIAGFEVVAFQSDGTARTFASY